MRVIAAFLDARTRGRTARSRLIEACDRGGGTLGGMFNRALLAGRSRVMLSAWRPGSVTFARRRLVRR